MASAKPAPAAADGEAAPKGKSKMLIIIVAALVLVLAAGGGAFVMLGKKKGEGGDKAKAESSESADSDHPKKHKKKAHDEEDTAAADDEGADEGDTASDDEEEGHAKAKKPAHYLSFTPSFVINLQDEQAMRYLQIDVDVMTRDEKAAEEIKTNMPRMRYELMMLFSQLHAQEVMTVEGKQKLQKTALALVRKIMKQEIGKSAIEGLYFTNFVLQ